MSKVLLAVHVAMLRHDRRRSLAGFELHLFNLFLQRFVFLHQLRILLRQLCNLGLERASASDRLARAARAVFELLFGLVQFFLHIARHSCESASIRYFLIW